MLRIAYCQISAHPAYCGANGNFCREPVYDAGGAVLTETSQIGTVNEICDKIYGLYTKKFCLKIQHLLQTLKREEIDILVFPEYTVPAECLPLLYEFCQSQNCICIAASHTVQQIHQPIYKSINLNITNPNGKLIWELKNIQLKRSHLPLYVKIKRSQYSCASTLYI